MEAIVVDERGNERAEACENRGTPVWAHVFNDEMIDFWAGEVLWNQRMAPFTTYRVGGCAEAIIFPSGIKELALLLQGIKRLDIPCRVIGGGSNVLVADEGLPGITLILGKRFARITVVKEEEGIVDVKVEAGCSMSRLISWCVEQGLSGLEFAAGIPGTVGGALVMNAGAWGFEIAQVLMSVTVMDDNGVYGARNVDDFNYRYRSWGEEAGHLAVEGVFRLHRADKAEVKKRCLEMVAARQERQPREPNCGSFFKNPEHGPAAGQLIEEAGLKGVRVGGAMVSHHHANFLVNTGKATARDLVGLMKLVQKGVLEKFGVLLEPEVRLLGFAGQE